jgi:uncharacterized protein (TIGR01244 family)
MADIRTVTPDFAVAPQLAVTDLAEAAKLGFKLVINNRPDGESPDQPSSEAMRTAAEASGLAYVYVPVRGGPTLEQVQAVHDAIEAADGPVLAFCRSGTRSIVTWSLGEAGAGKRDRTSLIDLGQGAGYDLSGVLG